MAKVTHVSQFAHDIAVRVLERFDKYGVCTTLAQDAEGRGVSPTDPKATRMCVTGRIVNAFPSANGDYYSAPSVQEIARTITGGRTTWAATLFTRNDHLFKEIGPAALRERTQRLFERIAALPVVDDSPTEFRVGGVYEHKRNPGRRYTVQRIVPAGQHTKWWCPEQDIVEYDNGGWDPAESICYYRRVA